MQASCRMPQKNITHVTKLGDLRAKYKIKIHQTPGKRCSKRRKTNNGNARCAHIFQNLSDRPFTPGTLLLSASSDRKPCMGHNWLRDGGLPCSLFHLFQPCGEFELKHLGQ